MALFDFVGRNANGKLIKGYRNAASSDELSEILVKEGLTPISIHMQVNTTSFVDKIANYFFRRRVSVENLGIFARQMYTLSKSGISIIVALKLLSKTSRSPLLTIALLGIAEKVEAGQDLASALEAYPNIFTPLMVSMVRVGQSSGKLDEAFLYLNQYLEMESSTMKSMRAALRYPAIVLSTIIIAIFLLNILVIPTFAKLFEAANVSLPLPTRIIIGISMFFVGHWVSIIFLFVFIVMLVFYYFHTPRGRLSWGYYEFKIPVIGKVLKYIVLLRFSQSFSMIVRSGVPVIEGIGLVAHTLENAYVEKKILGMQEAIMRGRTLAQAAADTDFFSALELQMFTVSEETGDLGMLLDEVAAYYKREVDYDLARLSDLIEPILITILAGVVLLLALAIYLPIWDMVKLVR